jgi:hypothetical protein
MALKDPFSDVGVDRSVALQLLIGLLPVSLLWWAWKSYQTRQVGLLLFQLNVTDQPEQNDHNLALERGCKPAKQWSSNWPLAIDKVLEEFSSARDGHMLQYHVQSFREWGTTFAWTYLSDSGIETIDPENLEALLSTNFNSEFRHSHNQIQVHDNSHTRSL